MSWPSIELSTQQKVIAKLKDLAVSEVTDEKLSNAFTEASFELELWLNMPHTDLFGEWLEDHKEELKSFAGQTVVVHLEKGILKHGPAEEFWDGKHHEEYNSDPSIFITIIPIEKVEGDVVDAVDNQ